MLEHSSKVASIKHNFSHLTSQRFRTTDYPNNNNYGIKFYASPEKFFFLVEIRAVWNTLNDKKTTGTDFSSEIQNISHDALISVSIITIFQIF